MLSRSIAFDKPDDAHLPVFIPQSILDEAAERSGEAGANETGGILIGRLHRDPDGPVFVEVTAQIPARHAKAEVTSLTFTRETWTDVQAALDLRASGGREIMVGWWHTHSFLKEICQDCQKRKDRTCNKDALFLSEDDRVLHRTVFPRAWNVALVVSDAPCSGLSYALFGWSRGRIARRGFHVLDGDRTPGDRREPSHVLSTSQERES